MFNKIFLPLSLALLCGCAQSSPKQPESTWWPFTSASKTETAKPVEQPQAQSSASSWWPFAANAKQEPAPSAEQAQSAKTLQHARTQAWLDLYEAPLRAALEGSGFSLERHSDVLAVTIPVQGSFNPDRPQLLIPAKLAPLTRMAKLTQQDPQAPAVLILGHSDNSGKLELNRSLSQQRAQAVAGIFRLSGFKSDRMRLKGVGSDMPRAANDSVAGRALNRRVEILLAPQDSLLALLRQYSRPATTALVTTEKGR